MYVYDLQSYKVQSLPQKDLFYLKEKAGPERLIQTRPTCLRHDVRHNAAQMFTQRKKAWFQ